MKHKIILTIIGFLALAFASCGTLGGIGRDIQSVGGAISEAADR